MTEMSQKWAKNKPKLKQQCTWRKIDEIQDQKWTLIELNGLKMD